MRRRRLHAPLLPLLLAATLSWSGPPVSGAPGNVVLMVVDDQGLDAGCYGNEAILTPHLDRLAAEGTRFRYAFCTTASCSASRSVILTGLQNHFNGQYGHEHSYHNFHTRTDVASLPVLLSKAGYRTARIGKYHVQPAEVYRFDVHITRRPDGRKGVSSRNPVLMAEACRPFLEEAGDRPFFLYFCTSDPHRGGGTAREKPHEPDRFGNRPPGRRYEGVERESFAPEEVVVPPFLPDIPECRAELAEYYESVHRVDQGLGRLVKVLEDTGHWDSTLILYLSDNGIAFPGAKTTLYDPGMRLPLVVRSPHQTKRGVATNAMVSWADLTPTILDFAGVKTEERFHGRSFLSVLEEEDPDGWDEVYASHTFHEVTMYYPMRVVRSRRYKYILNLAHALPYPFASDLRAAATWQATLRRNATHYGKRTVDAYLHRARHELYDLDTDPHEVVNLADDPQHANVLARLKEKLKIWQKETKDPWIVKYRYE